MLSPLNDGLFQSADFPDHRISIGHSELVLKTSATDRIPADCVTLIQCLSVGEKDAIKSETEQQIYEWHLLHYIE